MRPQCNPLGSKRVPVLIINFRQETCLGCLCYLWTDGLIFFNVSTWLSQAKTRQLALQVIVKFSCVLYKMVSVWMGLKPHPFRVKWKWKIVLKLLSSGKNRGWFKWISILETKERVIHILLVKDIASSPRQRPRTSRFSVTSDLPYPILWAVIRNAEAVKFCNAISITMSVITFHSPWGHYVGYIIFASHRVLLSRCLILIPWQIMSKQSWYGAIILMIVKGNRKFPQPLQ